MPAAPPTPPGRTLIFMPTWLGDTVMATPTIRALRRLWPETHLAALVREPIALVLDAMPWLDEILRYPTGKGRGAFGLARRLSRMGFDLAVLLPNSFRVAALATMSGIPRRVGYERDGRGLLLTDKLVPHKTSGRFIPVPTLDYYLGIARYLGADSPDPSMALFTEPEEDQRAGRLLHELGHGDDATQPLVLLNPGAQKATKRWAHERFAELARRLKEKFDADIAVTGSPAERDVLDAVINASAVPILDLTAQNIDLRMLKAVMRRCDLLVTNDTGTRHIAAAMDTAVVTLFGPTGPEWTEIDFPKERMVIAPGELDPSGESDRKRPNRHMGLITVGAVYDASVQLLSTHSPQAAT